MKQPILNQSFHFNRLSSLAALSLALSTIGCAGETFDGELQAKSQAIWGANDDANTLEANVVVNVSGCTGTLITPRIVLTAAHCTSPNNFRTVRFGNDSNGWSHAVESESEIAHPSYERDDPQAPHYSEFDMALIYLSEPVFDQAKITRPSLNTPTNFDHVGMAGWSNCGRDITQGNPAITKRQAAVFVNNVYESSTGTDLLNLNNPQAFGGSIWWRESEHTGVCFGDSGGTLFSIHEDGTREVFGVTSWVGTVENNLAYTAGFADITSESGRNWITENVLDANVSGPRSAAWLAAHGKDAATFWYGEADYTGVCDTTLDPDCDYWYSTHDSEPTVYNPEQLEEGGGGPLTPCSDLCVNPVAMTSQYFGSGQMGSQATCHETTYPMNGMACGNLAPGRQIRINGQAVACGSWIQVPASRNGGYCVQSTAGGYDWAYFQTW